MTISISQPTLFPWLGYFNMIKNSDVFVFLDNVKFKKQSWHMRNRLKSSAKVDEAEFWIRVPTKLPKTNTMIKDVYIDNNQDWKQKHLDYFQYNYGSHYKDILFLNELYARDWGKIAEFNIEFITQCCVYLDIKTTLVRASELNVKGTKSDLVLDICKQLNADKLLANNGSEIYLEKDRAIFDNENISITYHNFKHPKYNQAGEIFLENLSILDLLFSEKEKSRVFI
ncbi:WbqC family protein [Paucihalobacter ruber]|uniref:WbqC family protein n=1 Tax=Paucihalobacter ruber TaxID=2567861 RepID=A0A506PRR9_9FLAO|nr:WbqC family protein [Paucihalobacter ruber]TPV35987.1 WbqC family protein [Paucihalobacter ruber]